MSSVFQDSDAMNKIADSIEEDAEELNKLNERLYDLLKEKLGEEDDGNKAWFGPKSAQFFKNCEAKKEELDKQTEIIKGKGKDLKGHARAWALFERTNI